MEQPHILAIGGMDSSGGAGLSMDIRVGQFFQIMVIPIVTCITAQSNERLSKVKWTEKAFFKSQLDAYQSQKKNPSAIKIGLSTHPEILDVFVSYYHREWSGIPIILDPVLSKDHGEFFISHPVKLQAIIDQITEQLLPIVTLLKPNHNELNLLTKSKPSLPEEKSISYLLNQGCDFVLLSGGHQKPHDSKTIVNKLYHKNKTGDLKYKLFSQLRYPNHYRGTGCALSTAMACHLSLGYSVEEAVFQSLRFVNRSAKNTFTNTPPTSKEAYHYLHLV